MSSKRKLGVIVNPIAGMGGPVGLKGTDGRDILNRAWTLGAVPTSPARAVQALRQLIPIKDRIELLTYPHEMGEDEARECTFAPKVLGSITRGNTTFSDTRNAAKDMLSEGVDLMLFAGGDGTARDICKAIDEEVPVLGIPSGVKLHSAVFGVSPVSAGHLAVMYLQRETESLREAEVMDIDEHAFRENRLSARLVGYLKVPHDESMVQATKSESPVDEQVEAEAIADDFIENMQDDCTYIFGPGTTTRTIMKELGLKKALLGVDVVQNRKLLASDVNEKQLSELIKGKKAKIVVTVIGGQGFILGRGSQQISPDVIRKVGRENLLVIATRKKLATLRGRPLLVDTGDSEVDRMLTGYIRVITGYQRRSVHRVSSS